MSSILLVVAMAAEARPFLSHWRLRAVERPGPRSYRGERYTLIQTGIGKLSAAAATGAALALDPALSAVINVGIAGGGNHVGEQVLAHSVTDTATGKCWYPHLPPARMLPALSHYRISTIDQPSSDYRPGEIFDMEAAGVWSAASGFLDTSRIHAVKVCSDCAAQPLAQFDRQQVTQLADTCVPVVEALINALDASTTPGHDHTHDIDSLMHTLTTRIRHSVTETHQLRRRLQRLDALMPQGLSATDSPLPGADTFGHPRQLAEALETLIAQYGIRY